MATCYVCGCSGATYRREVYTGRSYGTFVSKRSYGGGMRSNYGIRTVCEHCAAHIDENNKNSGIVLIILIVIVVIILFGIMV